MAKRRRIGAALLGAAEGLSPLIQMLGRQQQADQAHRQQLEERAFQAQLQQELADRQGQLQLIQQGLKDPEQFNRLAEAGQTSLAGMDISKMGVSQDQAMGAAAGDIAKVKALDELPTDLDIEMSNRGRPGFNAKDPTSIEMLMAQRNAREAAIKGAAPDIAQTFIGPGGVEQSRRVNPYSDEARETLQTERTGFQEGTREGAIATAAAPGKTLAANTLEAGTRAEKVRTAGAVASTQESIQTRGHMDRLKQAAEFAAQDPAIAATADAVLKDPALLDKVDARSRKFVIAAMGADKFQGQAIKNSVQMQQTALSAVDQLLAHPGLEGLTGLTIGDPTRWTWSGDPIQGTNTADAKALFEQFRAAVSLPNLRYMQGLGHMSDREFGTVAAASTAADTKMSTPAFRQELVKVRQALAEAMVRNGADPGDASPSVNAVGSRPEQVGNQDLLTSARSKLNSRRGIK